MRKTLWIYGDFGYSNKTERKKLKAIQKRLMSNKIPNNLTFPYPNRAVVSASRANIDLVILEYTKDVDPNCYNVVDAG